MKHRKPTSIEIPGLALLIQADHKKFDRMDIISRQSVVKKERKYHKRRSLMAFVDGKSRAQSTRVEKIMLNLNYQR
ncbi:MAG: hypothetical protein IH594_07205 [Bacteroidales bacterium]|nr:hypothetical protein [Bacteroidales bacterium]